MRYFPLKKVARYHRIKSGLTQVELVDIVGVDKNMMYDIEKWRPSRPTLPIRLKSPGLFFFIPGASSDAFLNDMA